MGQGVYRINRWISIARYVVLLCPLFSLSILASDAQVTTGIQDMQTSIKKSKSSFDPSNIFLEIYQLSTAADRLSKSGNHKAALKSLQKADEYLNILINERPEWQPNVVKYRRDINNKAIEKLSALVKESNIKNPPKKADFIDGNLIIPNSQTGRISLPASPSKAGQKSDYEQELEERLRTILVELNNSRQRADQAESELKKTVEQRNLDNRKLAELEKELTDVKNMAVSLKSQRELALEKELETLKVTAGLKGSEREKELMRQLADAQKTAIQARASREEELLRQIASLKTVAKNKSTRELELEAQLRDLRQQMTTVKTAREKHLEKRLSDTLDQLSLAQQRADAAERRGNGGGVSPSYDALNQDLLRSNMELRAVTKALKETRLEMENIISRSAKAQAGESAYKIQLDNLRKQINEERKSDNKILASLNKQLVQLENKVKESESEKNAAKTELTHLQTRLSESEAQLADMTAERDVLHNERNQLSDLLNSNNALRTKEILEENLAMAKQLKEAQAQLDFLQANNKAQGGQLEIVQTELARVKQRMIEIRDENTSYRKRVSELSEKLRLADAEIEKISTQPNVDPKLLEENSLLREAISKQLRVMAVREKSRELLVAAYKRLKLQDPQMADAIRLLDEEGASLSLTDKEKDLLEKSPMSHQAADAVFVAPGYSSPDKQAQAYAQLQMEVDALGSSAANAYSKERYVAAEQLYQTLLDKHPGHYAAHINLGVINLKLGKAEEAQSILQNAVDLDPDHPTGQFLLGVAYYRTGRDAAAQMALTAATQIDPANARAYLYLGNIAASAGKTTLAVKHYEHALEIDPELVDVYYNLASTYLNANNLVEARKNYDKAIQLGALPDKQLEDKLRSTE